MGDILLFHLARFQKNTQILFLQDMAGVSRDSDVFRKSVHSKVTVD